MDMTKFLDESFDAKEWINASFAAHRDSNVGKDQYASTMVMKLQKFIQEVNSVIEESSQQALHNLPKVMREIDAVKQEACLLKEQMMAVKQDIKKVERDTSQSMQMLLKLDMIKGRMTAASDALKEADNWTTLSADVEDVFLSQDVNAMTSKLVGMQQSLHLLSGTVDYADRCQYLESLKNQLEAHLSPQIVSAFMSQSADAAMLYVNIFRDINRLPQLHVYYHNCQKKELLDQWKAIIESSPDDTIVEWLSKFLDLLLSTWQIQEKWCRQVFSESAILVCDLLADTLTSLDPTLTSLISAILKKGLQPLDVLIALKQVSDRFAKSVESITEPYLSLSPGITDHVYKLYDAIYGPYRPYIQHYTVYEEAVLQKDLDNIIVDHIDVVETVRLLDESANKLFHSAKLATERCIKFTDGFGFLYLIEAYKKYFNSYTREFQRVLSNVREKSKPAKFYIEEDWSNFQHSLRIIQTAGELIMRTEELEDLVVSSLLSTVGKLNFTMPSTDTQLMPLTMYDGLSRLLISDSSTRDKLTMIITTFQEGDNSDLFVDIKRDMYSISEAVHKLAFDVAFTQVQGYLSGISELEVWIFESSGGAVTSDLPDFSLSPQEYITKIGQYLMTLPQQLEPFTLEDNPSISVALKHGKLPYISDEVINREHISDAWLNSIAEGTMQVFCEEVMKIAQFSPHATKQLVVDIEYLCNVLEDLGLHPSSTLTHLTKLLQASPEMFHELSLDVPLQLVQTIAASRNIMVDL